MLFDLRSRGRRNVVKGVYSFLAVLMGAGLVLFGIGGAVSGGLLNAFNGSSGSSGTNASKDVANLQRIVKRNPNDAAAWARLAQLRFQFALADAADVNQANSTFTAKGKQALAGVDMAWNRYVALKPAHFNFTLAQQMEGVYGLQGLNQPAKVVETIEAVIAARKKPLSSDYVNYSVWASQANQTRKAALAENEAMSLAGAGKTGKARKTAEAGAKANILLGKESLAQQSTPAASTAAASAATP
jgi:hypothetical protein